MQVSFIYPNFLWLMLLSLPIAVIAAAGQKHSGGFRFWSSLGLRLSILLLLVFSLAGTQVRFHSDLLTTVFLLDASDSIPPDQIAAGEEFIREIDLKHEKRRPGRGDRFW